MRRARLVSLFRGPPRSRPWVTSVRRITEDHILQLSRKQQTGVSLRGLVDAGQNHLHLTGADGDPSEATKVLLTIAAFLHHELPIRLARRVVELDGLPSLHEMKSVRRVREWYARSASEIVSITRPTDAASERAFAHLLETIYERHAGVLYTMAQGAFELRAKLGNTSTFEDDASPRGRDTTGDATSLQRGWARSDSPRATHGTLWGRPES